MRTKAFLKSRDERKRVEMGFAHLKIHHGFERMRLRGLSGARDEFHLAAIVQNLKRLWRFEFSARLPTAGAHHLRERQMKLPVSFEQKENHRPTER
jgi:DDE family transposase